jgi:antitoxin YefM
MKSDRPLWMCGWFSAGGRQFSLQTMVEKELARDIDRILSMGDSVAMQTISYTDARNQLAGLMEMASRDREPITITRNGAGKVVLLAIEEYEAIEATLHLHSTRANARQIEQSLADYAEGKIQTGELCD